MIIYLSQAVSFVDTNTNQLNENFRRNYSLCLSISRDACAVPGVEYNHDAASVGIAETIGRKSSLLSSASDYARSISVDQQQSQPSNLNRAGSPYSDKTVSFYDERVKVKSK